MYTIDHDYNHSQEVTSELDPKLVRLAERFPVRALLNGMIVDFQKWSDLGLLTEGDIDIIRIASLDSDHGVNVGQMRDRWLKIDNSYFYTVTIQKVSQFYNESVLVTLSQEYGNGPLLLTIETLSPIFGLSIYLSSSPTGQSILETPFIKRAQDFTKIIDKNSNLESFSHTLTDPMKKQRYTYHKGPILNSTFSTFICNFALHVDLVETFF